MKIKPINKSWSWNECNVILHQDEGNIQSYRSLETNSLLLNESNELIKDDLQLVITLQKSFNFSKRVGWNWHKSWKIPELFIKLNTKSTSIQDPTSLRCRLICAYVEDTNLMMKVVPLEGIIDQAYNTQLSGFKIENIKFTITSYKNDGKYFHLIIEVYQQDIFNAQLSIKCVVSPPLFIDSRKAARNTKRYEYLKVISSLQPFHPYLLKKQQIVRQGKRVCRGIDDSIYGLDNYYTAQNIRNKCRHPFFVAIKFRSLFNIYFNTLYVTPSNDICKVVQQIQKILIQSPRRHQQDNAQQILLLHLKANLNEREMILFIQSTAQIKNHNLLITSNQTRLNHWQMIETDLLEQAYSQTYHKLAHLSEQEQTDIKNDFDISSDEGVSDQELEQQFTDLQSLNINDTYRSEIIIQKKVCQSSWNRFQNDG